MDQAKRRDVLVVVGFGAAFLVALFLELPVINSSRYGQWPWRSLDLVHTFSVFAGPLLMLGLLAWLWMRSQLLSAADARKLASGLFVCELLLQYARLRAEPGGWAWLESVVQSRTATSSYTDALRIENLDAFLQDFAGRRLELYGSTYPPGPVLFYWLLLQLAPTPELAARIAGASIAIVASFGVVVAFHFASLWTIDPARRLGASFAYALMPALLVALPSFDQLYPIFTMLGLIAWQKAIDRPATALWLGLLAFIATLMAYQFALLAIPFALYALCVLRSRGWDFEVRRAILRAAAIAFGTWLAAYCILATATPFHPLDSFTAALHHRSIDARLVPRPYGMSILRGPFDFALGGGILVLPLLAIHFARDDARETLITIACLMSLAIVDLTGLIRCEAARVWLFLQPLAIVPAGLTLSRFKPAARGLVLGLSSLILVAIVCKLVFLRVP